MPDCTVDLHIIFEEREGKKGDDETARYGYPNVFLIFFPLKFRQRYVSITHECRFMIERERERERE